MDDEYFRQVLSLNIYALQVDIVYDVCLVAYACHYHRQSLIISDNQLYNF